MPYSPTHFNIGKKAKSLETSPQFAEYTRVIVNVTDDISYTAGNTNGRTLTLYSPWGTQTVADNVLAQIRGYRYQPYSGKGVQLDPAAELGDSVTIDGVTGGIYTKDIVYGHTLSTDISAPQDEEIDHQYPYISPVQRAITRKTQELTSQLKIQADAITAEVSARETDSTSIRSTLETQAKSISAKVDSSNDGSFGWKLDATSWTLKSNGSTVLKATSSGIEITGKITATSGTIGGFTINENDLTSKGQTWGGQVSDGIYIGTNGIQLGKNFKVDNTGNLTAKSGTFDGWIKANSIIAGEDPVTGENFGYITGGSTGQIGTNTITGGWSGNISLGDIDTDNTNWGINTSLGYADFANEVLNGWTSANSISTGRLAVEGYDISLGYITVNGITHQVLKWGEDW